MKRKVRVSLRVYVTFITILILCVSSIVAFSIVCSGMKWFYNGEFTVEVVVAMCFLASLVTMGLGAVLLWMGARHLVRPIEAVSEAVSKVATGNFSIQVVKDPAKDSGLYTINEIDKLRNNFNKMTRELSGMDYMRKDFISNVSHEFKTPIAAITGFTEILLDGGISEADHREYLRLVNTESLRVSRLCENMLRMSRLDNQEIVTKHEPVQVDEQIRKCIIMLTEKWADKDIEWEIKLEKVTIASDADLLWQVWLNLIDNAIKYSREGTCIHIEARAHEKETQISIRDEGQGIAAEKLPHIFDKFYQCEESHKKQGNGLGLSIVKRIVELLEGRIICRSTLGVGTEMTVTLPKIIE